MKVLKLNMTLIFLYLYQISCFMSTCCFNNMEMLWRRLLEIFEWNLIRNHLTLARLSSNDHKRGKLVSCLIIITSHRHNGNRLNAFFPEQMNRFKLNLALCFVASALARFCIYSIECCDWQRFCYIYPIAFAKQRNDLSQTVVLIIA